MADEIKTEKTEPKKTQFTLKEAVSNINDKLGQCYDALTLILVKAEDKPSKYVWKNNSTVAKKVRYEVKKILEKVWEDNALNYQTLADALRVEVMSIRALIDADTKKENPHL